MTTDIALHEQGGTLALTGDQVEWTPVQRAALDHIGIADAPAADQQVFMHVCQRTGLDPFARQIYMIARREGSGRDAKVKWTMQTGIDGFRAIAESRPQYRGQVGPQWCGEDGQWRDVWVSSKPPAAARVGVLRDDFTEPVWGIAHYREYVQTKTWDGVARPTKMWAEKAAHQTAKCAEALAIRRAFPQHLSGLYTDDEMAHADSERGRARTVVEQDAQPVTAAELTGQPARVTIEHDTAPVADDEPARTPAPLAGGDRMSQQQQALLFALLGKAEIEDRKEWASGILGREITSYGQLSQGDASTLIDRLQEGLAALNGGDQ